MKRQNTFLSLTQFVKVQIWIVLTISLSSFGGVTKAQDIDIQDISLLEVTSGEEITFSQFGNKTAIVVIFFCNNCPYSTFYIDRIKALQSDHGDVQFLLVNSSNSEFTPQESVANMAGFIKGSSLDIPYLIDKDKSTMEAFGAKKCPEAFVVNPDTWQVVYHGAIDDNPQVSEDVSVSYLRNAIDSVKLGNKPSTSYERPAGCIIK